MRSMSLCKTLLALRNPFVLSFGQRYIFPPPCMQLNCFRPSSLCPPRWMKPIHVNDMYLLDCLQETPNIDVVDVSFSSGLDWDAPASSPAPVHVSPCSTLTITQLAEHAVSPMSPFDMTQETSTDALEPPAAKRRMLRRCDANVALMFTSEMALSNSDL